MATPRPRREGALLSWLFFGTAGSLSWLSGLDHAAPWLPFLLSIVVVGLPHGAADWLLVAPASRRSALRSFLLYTLAGGVIGIAAWLFPTAIVLGFLALSVVHFGLADERDLRSFESRPRRPTALRFGGVARIATFLLLVCALHPAEVAGLFLRVERLLGHEGGDPVLQWTLATVSPFALAASAGAWLVSLGGVGVYRFRAGVAARRERRFEVEAGEGVLLLGAAVLLEPIFAVGLYFLCWHAWRHCHLVAERLAAGRLAAGRLTAGRREDDSVKKGPIGRFGTSGKGRRWLRNLVYLHLRSWPLFLPVLPLMAALVAVHGSFGSPMDWVAAFLVVCILFTLPHHCIVERRLVAPERRSSAPDHGSGCGTFRIGEAKRVRCPPLETV